MPLKLPSLSVPDPYLRYVIQVAWRVIAWFVGFNLLYLIVQPLDRGITLYNSVFPGRLRLAYVKEGHSALMVNEYRLSRLLADHVLSRPKQADEYRILMLGSSELWGDSNLADETAPVMLDRMGIQREDGKIIHAYNLGYVWPNTFKDLMILTYTLKHLPDQPDAVVLFVNNKSFQIVIGSHPLYADNADLGVELIERYHIQGIDAPPLYAAASSAPRWVRHSFIGERDDLAYWLINQLFSVAWWATGRDLIQPPRMPEQTSRAQIDSWSLDYQGVLEAFAALSVEYHFEFSIVVPPSNYDSSVFVDALSEKTQPLTIPLLDCSDLLPPEEFTDLSLHFTAAGHQRLAQEIARWLEGRRANSHAPLRSECTHAAQN
jgi:hypothetical protein